MLDLYDQNGWVGLVTRDPSAEGLFDLPVTGKFLEQGNANGDMVDEMINELDSEKSLTATTLQALLKQATPPVLISENEGDERLNKFLSPEQNPTDQDEYDWAGSEQTIADNAE